MKMRRKFLLLTALLGITALSAVYAATSNTLKVKNHISVGDINIRISEYAKNGSAETAYQDPETILPGDHISKIVRIENLAFPCWVRVKLSYDGNTDAAGLDDSNLEGITQDWIKRGGYYYYKKTLNRKSSVNLFEGIEIPGEWTEAASGQKLSIQILAQAIQAANFTPDFTLDKPWGNQKIEECVHEQNGTMTEQKSSTKLSVELNGKTGELVSVPEDFFVNLGYAMPGDVFEDKIKISNTKKHQAELFFVTNTAGRTEEQLKMLKGVKLSISMEGKLLFRGSLASDTLKKYHSLGIYQSGEEKEMTFKLEIPSSWNNAYASKKTDITWCFKAAWENENSSGSGTGSSGSGNGSGADTAAGDKSSGTQKANNARTGDESGIIFWIIFAAGTSVIITVIARYRFGQKGEDRE